MLDSVGIKKIEEKSKQFLIEKIIHVIDLKTHMLQNLKRNQKFRPSFKETIKSQEVYTSNFILILRNILRNLSSL